MRLRSSWHLLLLGLVAAAVIAAGVLELGTPTSSARTSREVVTAAKGVVQSTVTGSGNVEPGTDVTANFQTNGTLQNLYVKTGDHVVNGQLIATLDPTAAQNTLNQAESNLTSAQDNLTNAEDAMVTTTTSQPVGASSVQYVALRPTQTTTASGSSTSGETAATKAANIASAQASVDGAEASVTTATTALHETHLYAPASGTVVSGGEHLAR